MVEEDLVDGSHLRSRGPLRVRPGKRDALEFLGSGVEGCLSWGACDKDKDYLGGGMSHLHQNGRRYAGAHYGNAPIFPDNAGCLGEGVNPMGEEGGVGYGRTSDHLDETWICADGHGPPSH